MSKKTKKEKNTVSGQTKRKNSSGEKTGDTI
jgi:hypothetical protein